LAVVELVVELRQMEALGLILFSQPSLQLAVVTARVIVEVMELLAALVVAVHLENYKVLEQQTKVMREPQALQAVLSGKAAVVELVKLEILMA
jgi:hypothetical protein